LSRTSTAVIDYDNAFPGKVVGSLASPAIGSWTVIAHYAWRADSLTKVACLAAVADRITMIARLGGRIVIV
jgi:hypothetical protein